MGRLQCSSRRWLLLQQAAVAGAGKKGLYGNSFVARSTSSMASSSSSTSANDVEKDNTTGSTTNDFVPLKHVPSLPVVGSMIKQHSGISMDLNDGAGVWIECRKKFGDFYTIGIPGIGAGTHGTLYVVQDPHEMAKVIRSEGKYPTSSVQDLWPFLQVQEDYGITHSGGGIMGQGEEWKRIRSFMQTDLLAPKSANRYLPGIIKATQYCSRSLPHHKQNVNYFLQLASFDMFCSVLLGAFPRITDPDPSNRADPEADAEFCQNISRALAVGSKMPLSPWETMLYRLGIKSSTYKQLYKDWLSAVKIGEQKIAVLEAKKEAGTLTEAEEASYWNQAMERWKLGETDLTKEEVTTICSTMFNASVDTTSAKTAWHFLHVALNPEAQERLYDEIYANVQESDGVISPGLFAASNTPYLGAVLRESNRLTCPANLSPIRKIVSDIEIHGHVVPAGSKVAFDQVAKSLDAEFVDDPFEFRPERFLPEAVAAR